MLACSYIIMLLTLFSTIINLQFFIWNPLGFRYWELKIKEKNIKQYKGVNLEEIVNDEVQFGIFKFIALSFRSNATLTVVYCIEWTK